MELYEPDETHGPDCCCCCAPADAYVEPAYTEAADIEPAYTEVAYVEPQYVEPQYVEPQYVEPQYVDAIDVEPSATVELGYVGGGLTGDYTVVDPTGQPVDLAAALGGATVVGGNDPVAAAPTGPEVFTIGGTNPYGMTIVPGDGTTDLSAVQGVATVGGPNAFSEAAFDVRNYAAQLDASLAGAGAGVGPTIPLTGGTINDHLVRDTLVQGLLPGYHRALRGLEDTMSPLYSPGDDIDPSSPYYNGRP